MLFLPVGENYQNKCKCRLSFDLAVVFVWKFSAEKYCMVVTFWRNFRQLRNREEMTRLQKAC